PYQVLVKKNSILARIPRKVFDALRAHNSDFSARIEATLQRRLSLVEQRLEFAHASATARVANALIEISEYFRGSSKVPRMRQNVIGSFAVVTRETVCSVMSALVRGNSISVSRHWIYLDLDRLRSLARTT
ncbi:MAG: Crp/Fnr family transcriptional regulator, partial [Nannocystaceae bacterium]